MQDCLLIVTSSAPVRDVLERVLAGVQMPLRHEMTALPSAALLAAYASVVICTLDVDWRAMVNACSGDDEIAPPVIVVTPCSDSRAWSEVLLHGGFDCISMDTGAEQLTLAVEKARARWYRARSVRDALRQNCALSRRLANS